MIIDNVEQWARQHANRKVRYKSLSEKEGRVVGYAITPYGPKIAISADIVGRDINCLTKYVVDGYAPDPKNPRVRWTLPSNIIGFVDDLPAVSSSKSKKIIGEWPHRCPACKGPAYIGFLTTVDCKAKCDGKKDD